MGNDQVAWQWDDTAVEGSAITNDALFEVVFVDNHIAEVYCADRTGNLKWRRRVQTIVADRAVLISEQGQLFVALYAHGFTGCQVFALDGSTGQHLWDTQLEGLGSVGHGRYSNRVQMKIRDGQLLVFGDEASGRYIEGLDPASGRQLYHRLLRAQDT